MSGPREDVILAELAGLRPGAILCPGELARRHGSTQAGLRAVLASLAAEKRVVITQRGVPADLATLRGPYRVALPGSRD